MNPRIAIATAALSCLTALPALAAHGNDVHIQGNPKKTLIAGEKGSYHLVEKGKRLTATVKGPTDVTVVLHGTSAGAAAGLFLDKKKIHFVDLKGTGTAKLSTGGMAGPAKTEQVSVPDGTHEIGIEVFTGGAAVSFRVAHPAGAAVVAATGKRHRNKGAAAPEPAPLAAEPIVAPPEVRTIEATPLTSPAAPAPVAAATPAPEPEKPAPAPAAAEDNSMMMGEPPTKPAPAEAAATPPPAPVSITTPAPEAATSNTTVSVETESKHGTATYWLAGAAVLLAAGAITTGALSSSEDSSYMNAKETVPNRASMLSTANTELIVSEALVGATLVALGASAIVAW